MKFDIMKIRSMADFKAFVFEEKNRRAIACILAMSLILGVVQATKGLTGGKKYVTDRKGNVVGLTRENGNESASYPLKIKAYKGDIKTTKDIVLTLRGGSATVTESNKTVDPMDKLNEKLTDTISEIENTGDSKVTLPGKLSDGTVISWDKGETDNIGVIFLLPVMLILVMYWNSREKVRHMTTNNLDNVRSSLPAFNNQLVMLLNCGLIFNDAFGRIAQGYAKQNHSRGYFQETVLDIEKESEETNRSLVKVLNDHANRIGVREFSRIVSIITDNQYKGVDLTGKLESESSILWNQRKKLAEEKGKLAETRLTFPLALLLIVLILITAAPAVLQVKGG